MSKPIASSKITRSFQVSIPKNVRDKINADEGDLILFFEREGEILIRTSLQEPKLPGERFQKLYDIREDTTIFHSKVQPFNILIFRWLNSERTEGSGILLEKKEFNEMAKLVSNFYDKK